MDFSNRTGKKFFENFTAEVSDFPLYMLEQSTLSTQLSVKGKEQFRKPVSLRFPITKTLTKTIQRIDTNPKKTTQTEQSVPREQEAVDEYKEKLLRENYGDYLKNVALAKKKKKEEEEKYASKLVNYSQSPTRIQKKTFEKSYGYREESKDKVNKTEWNVENLVTGIYEDDLRERDIKNAYKEVMNKRPYNLCHKFLVQTFRSSSAAKKEQFEEKARSEAMRKSHKKALKELMSRSFVKG